MHICICRCVDVCMCVYVIMYHCIMYIYLFVHTYIAAMYKGSKSVLVMERGDNASRHLCTKCSRAACFKAPSSERIH